MSWLQAGRWQFRQTMLWEMLSFHVPSHGEVFSTVNTMYMYWYIHYTYMKTHPVSHLKPQSDVSVFNLNDSKASTGWQWRYSWGLNHIIPHTASSDDPNNLNWHLWKTELANSFGASSGRGWNTQVQSGQLRRFSTADHFRLIMWGVPDFYAMLIIVSLFQTHH